VVTCKCRRSRVVELCHVLSRMWTLDIFSPSGCLQLPRRDWAALLTAHALLQSLLTISWLLELSLPAILVCDNISQGLSVRNLFLARLSVAAQARRGEADCLGYQTPLSRRVLRKEPVTATSQTWHLKRRATASAKPRSAFLQ
jgi:hypothetical protein